MHLHLPVESSATELAPKNLVAHFSGVPDPRINRRKYHELVDVLVIGVCTLLCGGETFNDMEAFGHAKYDWLKKYLKLAHGVPSHDTFNRVFALIDPQDFLACFLEWTQSVRQTVSQEIVAIDGKALRHASNKGESIKYVVSAWAEQNALVLGQLKVADKSNEITAVPEILRVLELSGCIVTIDAMGCQKKIAREIIEADADYVLALKGNQETVHTEVRTFLEDVLVQQQSPRPAGAKLPKSVARLQTRETVEKDHSRIEIRRYYQCDDLDWFADQGQWEKLRSVGMVESVREIDGKVSVERRFFLSSLSLDVETFARSVRGHWGVENKLNWVMDVCFGEDRSRVRAGNAAENLATLRRLALNLLRRDKTKKRGIRGRQLDAGWNQAYLAKLLGF